MDAAFWDEVMALNLRSMFLATKAVLPHMTNGGAIVNLSSLAALTPNLADFQPGFEDADTSVAAAVPFYGVYDFVNRHGTSRADLEDFLAKRVLKSTLAEDRARWEQASSISHIGSDAPPFFVFHGTNDSLVPVEQARTFVEELRKSQEVKSAVFTLGAAREIGIPAVTHG